MEVLALKIAIVVALIVWPIASVTLWRDEYHYPEFSFRSITWAVFAGFAVAALFLAMVFMATAALLFVILG